MKHIWTPWRMPYITGQEKVDGCVFCQMIAQDPRHDAKNYIVYRGQRVFSVLNLYPYNNGHILVLPYEHVSSLEHVSGETQADMIHLASYLVASMRKLTSPAGFNIGMNIGKAAGAGIDDHIHLHIVPRWHGDTNFMPVVAGTRVIPEWLDETYSKLRAVVEATPPSI
jgi:ATP adenylyltransferase